MKKLASQLMARLNIVCPHTEFTYDIVKGKNLYDVGYIHVKWHNHGCMKQVKNVIRELDMDDIVLPELVSISFAHQKLIDAKAEAMGMPKEEYAYGWAGFGDKGRTIYKHRFMPWDLETANQRLYRGMCKEHHKVEQLEMMFA